MMKCGKTVLVVEDELEILTLLTQLLTNAGYDVFPAGDAFQAISICENVGSALDLILTDYNLPGLNGIQLADRLQEVQPDLKTIFMSGNCEVEALLEKRSTFLRKPIDCNELLDTIRKTLELSLGDAPAAIGV